MEECSATHNMADSREHANYSEDTIEDELNHRDCGIFPIRMTGVRFFKWLGLPPAMTLPFVLLFGDHEPQVRTIRHETIHYQQYKELLFIFMLPLYLFHIAAAVAYFTIKFRSFGDSIEMAYRANPFEREAYEYQSDPTYLASRKRFAWVKYIPSSFTQNDY